MPPYIPYWSIQICKKFHEIELLKTSFLTFYQAQLFYVSYFNFKTKHVHFPKIPRRVLYKITIDLFHFWDVYDVNLWEQKFDRSTACPCKTSVFIWFHRFKKKSNIHSWRLRNWNKTFQSNENHWGFSKLCCRFQISNDQTLKTGLH